LAKTPPDAQVARAEPARPGSPAASPSGSPTAPPAPASSPPAPPPAPVPEKATPSPAPSTPPSNGNGAADDAEDLDWTWPAKGKLVTGFSDTANLKGIDIAGTAGQAIVASAPGRVVYAGSGLRGYGKLVIIKHNKTFLSAYAHNREIVVKEGQQVTRGQKIAEMGSTDTDQVKLHFEIRRLGRPMDPMKYLPPA
jgi:lipoprotein NlpD